LLRFVTFLVTVTYMPGVMMRVCVGYGRSFTA